MKRIAVLMASRNRRDQTLTCLEGLRTQHTSEIELEIYLVDDGSSDGTELAVRDEHPTVNVIRGAGNLYWGGAMRLADAAAWPTDPDYLLWLNDDVVLAPHAVRSLVTVSKARSDDVIVVGTVVDPISGTATYGGHRAPDKRRPITYELVAPTGDVEEVETMNGNVVLIPAAIRELNGSLDVAFSHNMADMDYALRARAAGFAVCLAPGFVGTCTRNSHKVDHLRRATPMGQRWRHIISKKGVPPREWFVFTRRHAGLHWLRYFVAPYFRALVPDSSRPRKTKSGSE